MNYSEEFLRLQKIYQRSYEVNKYSPDSLLWYSDKRNIRYDNLMKLFQLKENDSFLDIGCGFGDINAYFNQIGYDNYSYTGIDITKEFVEIANAKYGNERIQFVHGEFLTKEFGQNYDYVVISGIYNYRLTENVDHNYEFMFRSLEKALKICNKAVSFNFVTDQVDFKRDNVAYHNPLKVLEFSYSLTRRVMLYNDSMPFECNVVLFKNDEINYSSMLFQEYIREQMKNFDNGLFVVKKKEENE